MTPDQMRRDAVTVEIGYAVVTGALLAAAVFCLVASPVLLLEPSRAVQRGLLVAASSAAGLAFAVRAVRVLWRFGRRHPRRGRPDEGPHGSAYRAEGTAPRRGGGCAGPGR
ncbi:MULTISPECIES: DUF6332 family protein [Streptomyces]|uniref:DUF6332 family protein n=1 Tax=Streptomyces changanensis TaxID=2964669 RepID=A0ABY5N136_9ACTN|nr:MULTISPECIES: DUF6332 family protein [Streptomyces]UUS29871.1 DUF6332 family protein [Streptomyces changanensis]